MTDERLSCNSDTFHPIFIRVSMYTCVRISGSLAGLVFLDEISCVLRRNEEAASASFRAGLGS